MNRFQSKNSSTSDEDLKWFGELRSLLHECRKEPLSWFELRHYLNVLQRVQPFYAEEVLVPYLEASVQRAYGTDFSVRSKLLKRLDYVIRVRQLQRFNEHVVEQLALEPRTKLGPPANLEQLHEVERELELRLPLALRHLYTLADGISIYDGAWELSSLSKLVPYTRSWRAYYEYPDDTIPVLDWIDRLDVAYVKGHHEDKEEEHLLDLYVWGACDEDEYGTWAQLWGEPIEDARNFWPMARPLDDDCSFNS